MCCTRPSSSHPDTEGNLWHLDEKLNVTHLCQYETIKAAAQRDEVDNVTESREGRRSGLRCKTHTHEKIFIFSCIRTHIFSSSLCVCVLSLELSSRVSRARPHLKRSGSYTYPPCVLHPSHRATVLSFCFVLSFLLSVAVPATTHPLGPHREEEGEDETERENSGRVGGWEGCRIQGW